MTPRRRGVGHLALASVLFLSALSAGGCTRVRREVIPVSNAEVLALSPDDIARIMRQAGFSDEQILALGTDLRNRLAQSGAAQIRLADKVEAIFAVHGRHVYVSSRRSGSCIYDSESGAFR